MGVYIRLDEQLHGVFRAFENREILWRDFKDVGLDESHYDYYYAEDELYIVRDRVVETYFFVKARSPKEAITNYKNRLFDVALGLL